MGRLTAAHMAATDLVVTVVATGHLANPTAAPGHTTPTVVPGHTTPMVAMALRTVVPRQ